MKKAVAGKKKYFLDEEFWETISSKAKFDDKSEKVFRENTYVCTGAKYSGEWIGGFRFGEGKMVWDDGAKYEGEWVYGRAHGEGKFTHTKGEIYEGHWKSDKAHGYGVYIHGNGARYEGYWH